MGAENLRPRTTPHNLTGHGYRYAKCSGRINRKHLFHVIHETSSPPIGSISVEKMGFFFQSEPDVVSSFDFFEQWESLCIVASLCSNFKKVHQECVLWTTKTKWIFPQ